VILYSETDNIIINLDHASTIDYDDNRVVIMNNNMHILLRVPATKTQAKLLLSRISEAWGKLDRLCLDDYICKGGK